MAIEKKERYIIKCADGKIYNAVCRSFTECIMMFGEENITQIEKLDYEEEAE